MHALIRSIKALLPQALAQDRLAARRQLDRLMRPHQQSFSRSFQKKLHHLEKRLKTSAARRHSRIQSAPPLQFNQSLPIFEKHTQIIDTIATHPVVIVSGQTGSGKTTQIPQYCLAAGRGIDGLIGCTQPRRIAAMTVARRIAEELGSPPGEAVGYQIRFRKQCSPDGYVQIMTDGILLSEAHRDPLLRRYDTLIVDEAHERSLNIDFLLGLLRRLRHKRPEWKLVITSATIDTEKFSKAFDNAPVIEVSGRLYPVEVRYRPPAEDAPGEESDYVAAAVRAVQALEGEGPAWDALVFMPTEQDIHECCRKLAEAIRPEAIILPLYARLSAKEQSRVFAPARGRKIIVATNVAETSITIPGIRYVIDTGLARISRFSARTRTKSLPITPISRSSADQRMGRCGRVTNGICIRLYAQSDYDSRPLYTPPEIQRSNLAEVILRMIALNLGDIQTFPFIDRPPRKSIQAGLDLLMELGAVQKGPSRPNDRFVLTEDGRRMADLPLDPRLAKMLLEADRRGCLAQMAVLAAVLSIQDPRERPAEKAGKADAAQAAFKDPRSDFFTLLNIWQAQPSRKGPGATAQLGRFCKQHYLSFLRMREWRDIHQQILGIIGEAKWAKSDAKTNARPTEDADAFYADLHQCITCGFLSNIAFRKDQNRYQATKGREALIFPGSGLFGSQPAWIVAAEMVQTGRLYARSCARIEVAWLEKLGGSLCRSVYQNPRWHRRREQVVADQQVTLFGLVIVARRTVGYGPIDPEEATDIFIRSALVNEDVRQPLGFMVHNREMIAEVRGLEEKIRRRDLLIDEEGLVTFYRHRLENIWSMPALRRWIRKRGNDDFLRMPKNAPYRYRPTAREIEAFPDKVTINGRPIQCRYRFEPGSDDDGVTFEIPLADAAGLGPDHFDWSVTGQWQAKAAAMVRGLPKTLRRQLAPVSRVIEAICQDMPAGRGSLEQALTRFIEQRFGKQITPADWAQVMLAEHLQPRFSVIGPDGQTLRSGRDAAVLTRPDAPLTIPDHLPDDQRRRWERRNLTQWDFDDLPATIDQKSADGRIWTLHPSLVATAAEVELKLLPDPREAARKHRLGVAALVKQTLARDMKHLRRRLALSPKAARQAIYFGGAKDLEQAMQDHIVAHLFPADIRRRDRFEAHLAKVRGEMITAAGQLVALVDALVDVYAQVREGLAELAKQHHRYAAVGAFIDDLRNELSRLIPTHFLAIYDRSRFVHLQRFARALLIRGQRAVIDLGKDATKHRSVAVFEQALQAELQGLAETRSAARKSAIEDFFWMLEEYKVSVFAPELKTAVPVSAKRLNKLLQNLKNLH